MNAVADQYQDQGVGSIFLYTHEAHPGENYRHHQSMEDKLRAARALQERDGVSRTIYLDALDGACHRRFGALANMTWIFNRSGMPLYKSDWTDAKSAENAVIYYLDVLDRRRNREKLAPFKVERLDYRDVDKEKRLAGLLRAGPQALSDWQTLYDQGKLFFKPDDDPGAK